MKFSEALEELKKGKRITRTGWEQKNFLQMDEEGNIENFVLNLEPYAYDQTIILSDGWIIKGGPEEQKPMTFLEAMQSVKMNCSICLPEWEEMWVNLDKATSQLVLNSYRTEPFTPTFTCFMLNDWEVV
jgi:Protein of unknown function (DUF2829)